MAKGLGPILLLGGAAAAIWALSKKRAIGNGGAIVPETPEEKLKEEILEYNGWLYRLSPYFDEDEGQWVWGVGAKEIGGLSRLFFHVGKSTSKEDAIRMAKAFIDKGGYDD